MNRNSLYTSLSLLLAVLLLTGLLTGCAGNGGASNGVAETLEDLSGAESEAPESNEELTVPTDTTPTTEAASETPETPEETQTDAPTQTAFPVVTTEASEDEVETVRRWMAEPVSYTLSCYYYNLPNYGFDEQMLQTYGKDSSFNFEISIHYWNHTTGEDETQRYDWHYRYEDGQLVCYSCSDRMRMPISAQTKEQMDRDNQRIIGLDAILPEGTVWEKKKQYGCIRYSWEAPLSVLTQSGSFTASFIDNVKAMCGDSMENADPVLKFCLEVESGNLRPTRLTVDCTDVKPYVLSEGAMSGEFALKTNLLSMEILYVYDLKDTVEPNFSLETWELNEG